MTGRRQQISEINERRQVYNRINELKSNCEKLKHLRENLRSRLSELNDAADKLVDERSSDQYESCLRTDLIGVEATPQRTIHHQNREQNFTSTLATNDLNDKCRLFSSRDERERVGSSQRVPPSDAFKMKLSHCLFEVVEKAEEIVDLSERLANRSDTF